MIVGIAHSHGRRTWDRGWGWWAWSWRWA